MLEDLLKSEAKRFQEATLVHPAAPKMGALASFPSMPHVLQWDASGGTPSKRRVRLSVVASAGLKPLGERAVVFHYQTSRDADGEFVNYIGQELQAEDVAALKAAVDELIELSKRSQMS